MEALNLVRAELEKGKSLEDILKYNNLKTETLVLELLKMNVEMNNRLTRFEKIYDEYIDLALTPW